MARHEATSINEDTVVYWTTRDGEYPIRIVDEENRVQIGLDMREALRLAETITKYAQQVVYD